MLKTSQAIGHKILQHSTKPSQVQYPSPAYIDNVSIPEWSQTPDIRSQTDHVSQPCSIGSNKNPKPLDISSLITYEQYSNKQKASYLIARM